MNDMNLSTRMQELAMMADGGAVDDEQAMMMAQLDELGGSDEVIRELEKADQFAREGGLDEQTSGLEAQIVDLLTRQEQGDDSFSPEEMQLLEAVNAEAEGLDLDDDDDDDDDDARLEDITEGDLEEFREAAVGLASLGRKGDDTIGHLTTGEVVLPVEMMEDPEFAQAMMTRFEAMGIDPRARVVGSGIASLNDISGLEEFGFSLKKLGKSVKKRAKKFGKSLKKVAKTVVKVVAPIASIIPGPWQPLAIGITKLNGIRTAVKDGDILGGITAMSGLGGAGGGISSLTNKLGSIGKNILGAGKNLLGGVGGAIGDVASGLGKGIGGLFKGVGGGFGDAFGTLGDGVKGGIGALLGGDPYKIGGFSIDQGGLNIPGFSGGTFKVGLDGKVSLDQPQFNALEDKYKGKFDTFTGGLEDKFKNSQIVKSLKDYEIKGGDTLSDIAQTMGVDMKELMEVNGITNPDQIFAGANLKVPTYETTYSDPFGDGVLGFDPSTGIGGSYGQGEGQTFQQGGQQPVIVQNPQTGQPQIIYQQAPVQQGGGMGALGKGLAAGIPAALLAKFAYDEAKKDTGVQQNPMTSMSGMGRFNIEEEIARRTGRSAPNPVEYGLLPQGTLPQIMAAAPPPQAGDPVEMATQAYANGGYVGHYNDGGYVEEDFIEMDGGISGEGTERSDSIPAMLSDGEFVMNGQAVRGAGGYQMMNDGGIITLIPSSAENRGEGTQTMYDLMNEFENNAMPARG